MNKGKRLAIIASALCASIFFIHMRNARAGNNLSQKKDFRAVCVPESVTMADARKKLKGLYHISYVDRDENKCFIKFTDTSKFMCATTNAMNKKKFSSGEMYPSTTGRKCHFEQSSHYASLIRLLKSPVKIHRNTFDGQLVDSLDQAVQVMKK